MSLQNDFWFMGLALDEAEIAFNQYEVPVGAVIVSKDGRVISKAYNLKEKDFNPLAHAELIAIEQAAKDLKNWRLEECTVYVSLEPCPMCLSAMVQARIKRLVFGAYDVKGGALSLGYNFNSDKRLNHNFSVTGGVEHYRSSQLLSRFFRAFRTSYKNSSKDE